MPRTNARKQPFRGTPLLFSNADNRRYDPLALCVSHLMNHSGPSRLPDEDHLTAALEWAADAQAAEAEAVSKAEGR
jgi:hypothetical protein